MEGITLAAAWRALRLWDPIVAAVVCFGLYWTTRSSLQTRTTERDTAVQVAKSNAQALEQTRADVAAVTQRATAAAISAKRATDDRFANLKQEYDRDLHTKMAAAQQLATDYVRAHSVRVETGGSPADRGRLASAGLPGAASAAGKPDGPGGTAVMVAPADVGICTAAVIRLQNAVDWAAKLTR